MVMLRVRRAFMLYMTLLLCFITSVLVTPLVKKLAFKIGATDQPNKRKVHTKSMPRLGGVAIYISFIVGIYLLRPENALFYPILLGSLIIMVTGILDDIVELSAKIKLIGQLVAALLVVLSGLQIEFINLPLGYQLEFGFFGIPLTIIWIVGITNSINLIDGLDGLAAGVSTIALITISIMAIKMGNQFVSGIGIILIGATLGFLIHNFYPAKIFMGDTGALFLGYMISVLSLLGFKNVTAISYIIPVIILGVPISDTFFAIIRRLVNKQPLSAPDKQHLHHCLLRYGFSHKQSVLIIYGMSGIFGISAVIFSKVTMWGSITLVLMLLLLIELIVEIFGLVDQEYRPILKVLKGIRYGFIKQK